MSDTAYYVLSAALSLGILYGLKLMSDVKTAALGNRVSALCMLLAIITTMARTDFSGSLVYMIIGLLAGTLLSIWMTLKVKMIQMPQMVGLLNGLGGLGSALAAILTVAAGISQSAFQLTTSGLALGVGALTFSGSLVAAGKLQGLLPPKPIVYPGHRALTGFAAAVLLILIILLPLNPAADSLLLCLPLSVAGLLFGWLFAIRVGGADMPITISLLNSTSGVAAAIAGMALGDILLVAVGGIVGASGLLLTQIMCRSMNRSLSQVLFGGSSKPLTQLAESTRYADTVKEPEKDHTDGVHPGAKTNPASFTSNDSADAVPEARAAQPGNIKDWLANAQSVIIIPGYGMALSQAQEKVKQLTERLQSEGKTVRFAIHPVAGRMPGHMNVLLAEVDIPYELLCEMEEINRDFHTTDLAVVIGANDVVNPAANTAQGTPIYGMPILDVSLARHLIICNYDTKPGYAGVDNPLYEPRPNILLLLGDAKDSLDILLSN